MSALPAYLGLVAVFGLSGSATLGLMPEAPPLCHGGRDLPEKPQGPVACHAVTECAAHRKLRTFT